MYRIFDQSCASFSAIPAISAINSKNSSLLSRFTRAAFHRGSAFSLPPTSSSLLIGLDGVQADAELLAPHCSDGRPPPARQASQRLGSACPPNTYGSRLIRLLKPLELYRHCLSCIPLTQDAESYIG